MNSRYTLIIALLAIAAGIFAYTQRDAKPVNYTEGAPTATPAPFLDLDKDKLQEVEVATTDGKVLLKRAAGGWEVDGKGMASDTVGGTLERLAKPEILRDLGTEAKPEDYGLATASMTVTLTLSGGESTVVQVGDKHPIDPQYYVRKVGEQRIVILSSSDWDSLKDWIANAPLAPTATPATEGTPSAEGTGSPDAASDDAADTAADDATTPDDGGEVAPVAVEATLAAAPVPTVAATAKP